MILISHRGNLNQPVPSLENNPIYINNAIDLGFDVEVDLWYDSDTLYLGHDAPIYGINYSFLETNKNRLWVHCKNLNALRYLYNSNINYFWHQEDDFTLTSKGNIWTYPNKNITDKSVVVCKDKNTTIKTAEDHIAYGICSDYVNLIV